MINTELFKKTMKRINDRVSHEKAILLEKDIPITGSNENESVDNLLTKSEDTTFRLLVMGRFSSGKSALINVLLGEKLLAEAATPMTGLITEIQYGTQRRVVMVPRKGKWQGGDEPFDIEPTLEEIKKYSTINNKKGLNTKEANRVDSVFEKMLVYWPLEMLRDGVMIIDSPGTDDPYNNDHIVEAYVPKADAILFCTPAIQAYTAQDKKSLSQINSMGFTPLIVTTYADVVFDGLSQEEIDDFIETENNNYKHHTSEDCCHYVNSKLGIQAKKSGVHSDLVASGYAELESFLGVYLTENKGKEKIAQTTAATKVFNAGKEKQIQAMSANLDTPLDEFNQRMKDAEKALDQAKLQGDLLSREFKVESSRAQDEIFELIPELYDEIYNSINLDGFTPDTSFTLFHPKNSSEQIAEECTKELQDRQQECAAEWSNNILMPKVTESFQQIEKKMKSHFEDFSQDIEKVQITLGTQEINVDAGVHGGTRVAMFAYALLTGDWVTALVGGALGAGAFGRTLVCQFTAGLILGIVALFTPIGLPALIIGSILALITGIGWTASKAADTIKKKTVEEMKKSLNENRESISQGVKDQCAKFFSDMEGQLKASIDGDVQEMENTIELIRSEREAQAGNIAARRAELEEVSQLLASVSREMDSIRDEFKIA